MRNTLARISSRYGIDEPLRLTEVTKGFQGTNFLVETRSRKYFLKQYRTQYERAVREIHRVQEFFASRRIPVLLPLATRDGSTYVNEQGRYYGLYPLLENPQPQRDTLPLHSIHSLATTLASIHRAGRGARGITTNSFRFKPKRRFYSDARFILDEISHRTEFTEFDELAEESLRKKLALASRQDMRFSAVNDHLTHGDYHDGNVFFKSDGTVGVVFDFDDAYVGPRTFELVRSMDYICFGGEFTPERIDRAREYLAAYASEYPVSRDELLDGIQIYFYRLVHNLWIEKEHYLRGNNRPDSLLPVRLKNLTFFSKNLTRLGQMLASSIGHAPVSILTH